MQTLNAPPNINGVTPCNIAQNRIRHFLIYRAIHSLRRAAGYIPAQMPAAPLGLPSVAAPFAKAADTFMSRLCRASAAKRNPRLPYIYLAWLLISRSNAYNTAQYLPDSDLAYRAAAVLLRIASGDMPDFKQIVGLMDSAFSLWHSAIFEEIIVDNLPEQVQLRVTQYAAKTVLATMQLVSDVLQGDPDSAATYLEKVIQRSAEADGYNALNENTPESRIKVGVVIHLRMLAIVHDAQFWLRMDEQEAWLMIQCIMEDVLLHFYQQPTPVNQSDE